MVKVSVAGLPVATRAIRLATQLLTVFFSGERRGADKMRRTGWVSDERIESWLGELSALTGMSVQDPENMPDDMTAADECLPYFAAVFRVLAVEVGEQRAEYLAARLVDEHLARKREAVQERAPEVVQVPADAEHRLGLAVTFPAGPLVRSVLDEIRHWPRGRAALEPRPSRVWRFERPVSTVTPSGMPWAGEQLQITVHPDGEPTVIVRRPDRHVALLLPVSEVEASQ